MLDAMHYVLYIYLESGIIDLGIKIVEYETHSLTNLSQMVYISLMQC